jgi:primase-polymerase (primpol)-like protein
MKRWVVWNYEERVDEKTGEVTWTKPPYQPDVPKVMARVNDPSTWGSYYSALNAVMNGEADGVGVMLLESELAAADIDHVRDPENHDVLPWAAKLCDEADKLGLYREVTVSGTGFRFIGVSTQKEKIHRKFTFDKETGAGVELYRNCARYITISGMESGACGEDVGDIDEFLNDLLAPQRTPQKRMKRILNPTRLPLLLPLLLGR